MEPSLLVVVLRSDAHELIVLGIIEAGDPSRKWSKLMTQVEIVNAGAIRKVNAHSKFRLELVGTLDGIRRLLAYLFSRLG